MTEILTYENWDEKTVANITKNQPDYFNILKWAFKDYSEDIIYACSFGAEGIVLIDLIYRVNRSAKIVFLDTGLHFAETYELIEEVKNRYPSLQIILATPKNSLEEQSKKNGEELWNQNPNLCCQLRKIDTLKVALKDVKAWISGLRREQSSSRSHIQYINKDEKFNKIKICPLIHWTWEDVMTYINLNHLPYNPLHDKGYSSIGCAPCTKPVTDGGDLRSGRWANQLKTECGLHLT